MRSVFIIFEKASRAEVSQNFDATFARNGPGWIYAGSVYIGFYDDAEVEFEPDLLETVRALTGKKEIVAVGADISGRIPGDKEVLSFCSQVLGSFTGRAMDDYSSHLWTLAEIQARVRYADHPFFDYDGWYEKWGKEKSNQPPEI